MHSLILPPGDCLLVTASWRLPTGDCLLATAYWRLLLELAQDRFIDREAILWARKSAAVDILGVLAQALADQLAGFAIAATKRQPKAGEQPKHLVCHQHLTIAVGPGANTDR